MAPVKKATVKMVTSKNGNNYKQVHKHLKDKNL